MAFPPGKTAPPFGKKSGPPSGDGGPPAFKRKRAASNGNAMPGGKGKPGDDNGRFPIENESDLKKAIRLAGNAKGDKAKVRGFIKRRAAALNLSKLIPSDW